MALNFPHLSHESAEPHSTYLSTARVLLKKEISYPSDICMQDKRGLRSSLENIEIVIQKKITLMITTCSNTNQKDQQFT